MIRLLLVSGLLALAVFFGEKGLVRYSQLRGLEGRLAAENEEMTAENQELVHEIKLLSDRRYLERLIRAELGLVRADEVVYEWARP